MTGDPAEKISPTPAEYLAARDRLIAWDPPRPRPRPDPIDPGPWRPGLPR